ncbi:TRAP transporter small permease [Cereibacter sphaeroides]|nr:TRAP transporter small permease [Cereibacter sphaeroides]
MSETRHPLVRFSDGLDRVASLACQMALALLVSVVFLQVVARYVFASPPPWTEELARYCMIWAGLMGATLSFKRRFDPALMTASLSSPVLALLAGLVRGAVVLIYLLPILWFSVFGPNLRVERGYLMRNWYAAADTLPFSLVWVAVAVPLMILILLAHLAARAAGDRAPAKTASGDDAGGTPLKETT